MLNVNFLSEIKNIMVKLRDKGKTIIVVTHSVNHALEIADNVVVVNDKKIMDSGEPYKIFTNKQLMELTNISVPSIIKVIDELIKKDSDYESLLEFKPRTVEDLAKYITVINKGGK
jgi:energy-coupling factor transport system ATP-binding protein